MFFIDIIVIFRTTIAFEGETVTSGKIIAINYLKGRFFIDFFSTVPLDLMMKPFFRDENIAARFKLLALLKLIRMLRLSHIISVINVKQETKTRLKLLKLFFFLVMYIHCWACLWFMVVK